MALAEFGTEVMKFINRLTLRPSKEIRKVINIYDTMHKVIEETDVQRIVICRVHNGGGVIQPTTPLYISALYEDYTAPFKTVKDNYQKLLLDEDFIRVLHDLCTQKVVKIYTDDLKDGTLQKRVYVGEGVQYAEKHFLGQDRRNLYYVSFSSAWVGGWSGKPAQELIINLAVNVLRNNII